MTLEEAIEIGLKNSPDFLMQKNRVLLAQEGTKLKKASNYGKLALSGSFTRYNIPRTLAPIVPPIEPSIVTSKDIGSLGLAYNVNLFNGFSTTRDIEIASLAEDMAEMSISLSREQLIYNIRSIYLKILSLKAQKGAANSYVNALKKLHKVVSRSVKVGKKAKVDVLKVQADLESAKAKVQELKNNITILKSSLATVIGVDSIDHIEDTDISLNSNLNNKDITSLTRYKLSLLKEQKSDKLLKNAKSNYYPKLDANGYYGNNYGDGESDNIWQIGVGLNWVLFDFGTRSSLVQKAKIEKLQSSLETRKTKLIIQKELNEAKSKVDIAVNNLQSARVELDLVHETLKIEDARYKQGVGTIYDLLFAKSRYQNTQAKEINAKYQLQSAIYYYKYITENGETI
jgi:outer membrane protein TolC